MEHKPPEKRFDGPESGPSWAQRAQLEPLEAVLDPGDTRGDKNRLIDKLHKRALASAVGSVQGKNALDFGCGTGRLSEWLVDNGAEVDGVDVTPEMIAVARRRVPRARFQTIDGSNLLFADGRFDLVVTAYVLQYYVEGDGSIPRELARILRSGGRVIAVEQVTESDLGSGGTRDAYERMFIAAGFTDVHVSPIRMSDSRIFGVVQRLPAFSRLPLVPWLMANEAARRSQRPLIESAYADTLFSATKA
jgi:SAM-dependent methyltransferase